MKIERAVVISVCTWIFCVVLAAAAQSIAEDRPPQTSPDTSDVEKGIKEKSESAKPSISSPQTSPDTTVVDNAIKEKLESASTGAGASSPLKASSSSHALALTINIDPTGIDFLGPVSSRWNADGSCTAGKVWSPPRGM
jgi:hypothetical protein